MTVYKVEIIKCAQGYVLTLDNLKIGNVYQDLDRVITIIKAYYGE